MYDLIKCITYRDYYLPRTELQCYQQPLDGNTRIHFQVPGYQITMIQIPAILQIMCHTQYVAQTNNAAMSFTD
jgi:hypothetical protein